MSKAASSPTARLLQHSRLFSLPRPLPQPALETITSAGVYRASESATLPYPTRQAIATPESSRHRGDWGLKRTLPAKSTRSSTRHIRVSAQDNTEHITDFSSAGDHTQTEAKWQEMGVPLLFRSVKAAPGERRPPPTSVFEEEMDNTDSARPRQSNGGSSTGLDKTRWKYNGPWLAGMQDGEFAEFVRNLTARKTLAGQKSATGSSKVDAFREYLRERVTEQALVDARRQAQEEGQLLSSEELLELRSTVRPNDIALDAKIKDLRDSHEFDGLSSDLTSYICDFLDLPAVRPTDMGAEDSDRYAQTDKMRRMLAVFNLDTEYAESAPPSTHPSAGLSYLRTNAVMENHPLHGPQAHRAPVLARVVRPRISAQGTEHQAKLGVGGIVANDPTSQTYRSDRAGMTDVRGLDPDKMVQQLDQDVEGGNKLWVHPTHAWVDEKGRIRLEVIRGDKEAIAVKTDDVEHIHQARAASTRGAFGGAMGSRAPPGTAGNANFGHSLPDTRRMRSQEQQSAQWTPDQRSGTGYGRGQTPRPQRRPEVRGFDEELGRGSQEGRFDEESATSRIRELLESRGRR